MGRNSRKDGLFMALTVILAVAVVVHVAGATSSTPNSKEALLAEEDAVKKAGEDAEEDTLMDEEIAEAEALAQKKAADDAKARADTAKAAKVQAETEEKAWAAADAAKAAEAANAAEAAKAAEASKPAKTAAEVADADPPHEEEDEEPVEEEEEVDVPAAAPEERSEAAIPEADTTAAAPDTPVEEVARHAVETPQQAIEDIASTLVAKGDAEKDAVHLDFGDVLLQKALAAAEAVGLTGHSERRSHLTSSANGISAEKKKLMDANHTKAETCQYKCTGSGLFPVAKPGHDAKTYADGCGAPGLKVNADFPFDNCCHGHDTCYSTCDEHKNNCDLEFIHCMNSTCNNIAPNDECRGAAVTLFDDTVTLSKNACDSYLGAQGKACACTGKTKEL